MQNAMDHTSDGPCNPNTLRVPRDLEVRARMGSRVKLKTKEATPMLNLNRYRCKLEQDTSMAWGRDRVVASRHVGKRGNRHNRKCIAKAHACGAAAENRYVT